MRLCCRLCRRDDLFSTFRFSFHVTACSLISARCPFELLFFWAVSTLQSWPKGAFISAPPAVVQDATLCSALLSQHLIKSSTSTDHCHYNLSSKKKKKSLTNNNTGYWKSNHFSHKGSLNSPSVPSNSHRLLFYSVSS